MRDDLALLACHGKADILLQAELAARIEDVGVDGPTGMNIGGTFQVSGVGTTIVRAFRSSSTGADEPASDGY